MLIDEEEEELRYQYYIQDHLGNVVVTFEDKNEDGSVVSNVEGMDPGTEEVVQRELYYPFGLHVNRDWWGLAPDAANRTAQQYQYNGKELDENYGLGLHFYGARMYDAAVGRFMGVDPLAEKYESHTPYHYVLNSPLIFVDPDGRSVAPPDDIYLDKSGKITKIVSKAGPHNVFIQTDWGYHQLTINDPSLDNEEIDKYIEGDKMLTRIEDVDIQSIMNLVSAGSGEGDLISNSYGKYDFAYGVLDVYFENDIYPDEERSRAGRSHLKGGGFYLFGEGFRAYNLHDSGNYLWGFANQLEGHGLEKLTFGAHLNEILGLEPGDTRADQNSIISGHIHARRFALPPDAVVPILDPPIESTRR